jgi:5-methylcytosine-specific restriction endonuclease McrA
MIYILLVIVVLSVIVFIVEKRPKRTKINYKRASISYEETHASENKTKYERYLETNKWKRIAKDARAQAKYKCQLCGEKNQPLHVHHNTYDHIYREARHPEDLIVLCKDCHTNLHQYLKKR